MSAAGPHTPTAGPAAGRVEAAMLWLWGHQETMFWWGFALVVILTFNNL